MFKISIFLATIAINFHSGGLQQPYFLLYKMYSLRKIWKKPNDIACFFTFFKSNIIALDLIWDKFCPIKTTPNLILFAGLFVPMKYVGRIQLMWKI